MKCSCASNGLNSLPSVPPLPLTPTKIGQTQGVVCMCVCVCVCVCECVCWRLRVYLCVQLLCDRFPEPEPSPHGGKWRTVATTGQFYSAPGWMLNLYLMYDISHKSSGHRHDPGVFRRLLFQCLSNCGIIRPREREGERGSKKKKPLSLVKWSPSHCSGHPRLEARSLSLSLFPSVISWSQGCAKLKTSWQSGGCMK